MMRKSENDFVEIVKDDAELQEVVPRPDVENGWEYRKRKFASAPQYIKDMIAQEERYVDGFEEFEAYITENGIEIPF